MNTQSYNSGAGRTGKVEVDGEEYLIVTRPEEEKEGFDSIDISFESHTIRIYDDRPWKVHHMNSNNQTIEFPVLQQS